MGWSTGHRLHLLVFELTVSLQGHVHGMWVYMCVYMCMYMYACVEQVNAKKHAVHTMYRPTLK